MGTVILEWLSLVLGDGQMVLQEENQGEQGGHTLGANGRQSKLYAVWIPAHTITRLGELRL